MSGTSPSHRTVDDFLSSLSETSRKRSVEDEQRRRNLERDLDELRQRSNSSSPVKRGSGLGSFGGYSSRTNDLYGVKDLKFSREKVSGGSQLHTRESSDENKAPPLPRRKYQDEDEGPPLPKRPGDAGSSRREGSGFSDLASTSQSTPLKLGMEDTINLIRPVAQKEPTKSPTKDSSRKTYELFDFKHDRDARNKTGAGGSFQSFLDIEDNIKGKSNDSSIQSLKTKFDSGSKHNDLPPRPKSKPKVDAHGKISNINANDENRKKATVDTSLSSDKVHSKPKDKPILPPKPTIRKEWATESTPPVPAKKPTIGTSRTTDIDAAIRERREIEKDKHSKAEFKQYAQKDVQTLNSAIAGLSSSKLPPPKPKKLSVEAFEKDKTELLSSQLKRLGQGKINYREIESKKEVPEVFTAINKLKPVKPASKPSPKKEVLKSQVNKSLPSTPPTNTKQKPETDIPIHTKLDSIFSRNVPTRAKTNDSIAIIPKPVARSSTDPGTSGAKLANPNKDRVRGPKRRLPKSLSSVKSSTPASPTAVKTNEAVGQKFSTELQKQRKQPPPVNKQSKPRMVPELKPTRNISGELFI